MDSYDSSQIENNQFSALNNSEGFDMPLKNKPNLILVWL